MKKYLLVLFLIVFIVPSITYAIDIPVFSLIFTENSSGYICSGDSIGCSSLSSIYKVEKRSEDIYICPSSSTGDCSPLYTLYKTSKHSEKTTYICPSNSIGNCSIFNVLYKISKHDENTSYLCSGDSIGDCSIFNVLYKISKHDTDTSFACSGDSIGNCSIFNVLYKFIKVETKSSGSSSSLPTSCPSNSSLTATGCVCNSGYITDSTKAYCVVQQPPQLPSCPINSNLGLNNNCYCINGYELATDKKTCVKSIPVVIKIEEAPTCNISFLPQIVEVEKDFTILYKTTGQINNASMKGTGNSSYYDGSIWDNNTDMVKGFINGYFLTKQKANKIGPSSLTLTATGLNGSGTCTASYTVIQKSILKNSSENTPSKIQEKIKTEEKIISVTEPKKEATSQTTPEPVKKLKWYQKIFNWFK